jgi:UDP-N-acetylglucosamine acyltransferase
MANATLLGGHVHIHDDANLSAGVLVNHYSSIGSFSFTGALSRVLHDVPPYMLAEGNPSRPRCLNIVALKRNDFSLEAIAALSEAHRLLFRSKMGLDNARELLRASNMLLPAVNHLLGFLQYQHEGRHGRGRDRRRAA